MFKRKAQIDILEHVDKGKKDAIIGLVCVLGLSVMWLSFYTGEADDRMFSWLLVPAIVIGFFLSLGSLRRADKGKPELNFVGRQKWTRRVFTIILIVVVLMTVWYWLFR